jgi:hypothetical protein
MLTKKAKTSLIELLETSRGKIGKPFSSTRVTKATREAIGELEVLKLRITETEEQLATLEGEVYRLTSMFISLLKEL